VLARRKTRHGRPARLKLVIEECFPARRRSTAARGGIPPLTPYFLRRAAGGRAMHRLTNDWADASTVVAAKSGEIMEAAQNPFAGLPSKSKGAKNHNNGADS
jgi:hypothetical protein